METFLSIWFVVSSFVILHLYLKNKTYKEKTGEVLDQVNDVWDNDYKKLISDYGTVAHFIECHEEDFKIFRHNFALFYEEVALSLLQFLLETESLLSHIESGSITKKEISLLINDLKKHTINRNNELLKKLNDFLINEEEAHTDSTTVKDALEKINKKYKIDIHKYSSDKE